MNLLLWLLLLLWYPLEKHSINNICDLQFSETGNQSLSVLTFTPTIDDDGKYLTCRAENPFIADSIIEDKWRLVVHCKYNRVGALM